MCCPASPSIGRRFSAPSSCSSCFSRRAASWAREAAGVGRNPAMPEALLETRGLSKRFGGLTATDDVSLSIMRGELHAVIGPNGAGKTTLIAQLAGEIAPDAGAILFAGED